MIDKLKNKVWRKRGKWHHTVLFSEMVEGEHSSYSKKIGLPFIRTKGLWLPDGNYLDLEEEWVEIRDIVEKEYSKDPSYLLNYANKCLSMGEEVIEFSKEIGKVDASILTDEELTFKFKEVVNKIKEYMPFMFSLHLFGDFLTEKFDVLLNEFIKEKEMEKKDFFEYQRGLTVPFRKIFVLNEKRDLMKIAVKKKKGIDIIEDIENHVKNHSWINFTVFEDLPHTKEYFMQKIEEIGDAEEELQQMDNAEKELNNLKEKCMENIKDCNELKNITEAVQVFGFLRSFRIDVPFVSMTNAFNLVKEITKRIGINEIDIKYLDTNDIEKAFEGFDVKPLIAKRKEGFLTINIDEDRYEIDDSEKIKEILEVVNFSEGEIKDFVKGNVAFPGKITGTVKVLHKIEDMNKVEKGDIIVLSMTDPNYIPVMEKAASFVTDRGGILCHAAIVSREMKKPCVIGTKIATKTFKDGDMVEVDADEGIVKKIIL